MAATKTRLDKLLVDRSIAQTVKEAQGLILAGLVSVNGQRVDKAGQAVEHGAVIDIKELRHFVSRGGDKLAAALDHFKLNLEGQIALDLGSSTGGFTECMLERGARKVYCVDSGSNQLAWKLRSDSRVVCTEQLNARHLLSDPRAQFEPKPTFATIDVSFISLTAVLEPVCGVMASPFMVLALVKPHFELPKHRVSPGGVVPEESDQIEACESVVEFVHLRLGLIASNPFPSPLRGLKGGNQEYFILIESGSKPPL